MKRILIGALVISCAVAMTAGAATQTTHHAGAAKSLTGCLEKGDEANTFKLTNVTGGGEWELVGAPAALKMSDHLGHKVEVSGTSLSRGRGRKGRARRDEEGDQGGREDGEEGERRGREGRAPLEGRGRQDDLLHLPLGSFA